jgi:hypothetical protein
VPNLKVGSGEQPAKEEPTTVTAISAPLSVTLVRFMPPDNEAETLRDVPRFCARRSQTHRGIRDRGISRSEPRRVRKLWAADMSG